jgi:kumamolisin
VNARAYRRVGALAFVVAICLAATSSSLVNRVSSGPAQVTAALKLAHTPKLAGRSLPATARVTFDLVLRLHEGALNAYARGLFAPSSPLYGHYLSPAQFGQKFGPSASALTALERQLRRLGLRVVGSYPQETLLRVSATAAAIQRAFGVTLRQYRERSGQTYLEPSRAPVVPHQIASLVSQVSGLDTHLVGATDSLPGNGRLQPYDIRTGYDMAPLQESDSGQGATIAVLSIGPVKLSDYNYYAQAASQSEGVPLGPEPQVQVLSKLAPANAKDDGEGDLDLEVIHSIVPDAQIIDYETNLDELPNAITTVADNTKATIVSASFGLCDGHTDTKALDDELPTGYRSAVESALMAAALKGITFFVASGDTGAYACQQMDSKDTTLSVQFPSDDPYVVSVGGTDLSLNADGGYASETAWGDSASNGGGGGGFNPIDPPPPWQASSKIEGISLDRRELPDVSAAGGDASPWDVYEKSSGGWTAVWGTSEAAPIWSASALLVQLAVQKAGAGPLCFAAPLLYAVAERSWTAAPFHDVTLGNNRYFKATPGWDLATGWGSPDLANLASAIVSYRSQNPLPSSANACSTAP